MKLKNTGQIFSNGVMFYSAMGTFHVLLILVGRALMAMQSDTSDELKMLECWKGYILFSSGFDPLNSANADTPSLGGFEKTMLANMRSLLQGNALQALLSTIASNPACPLYLQGLYHDAHLLSCHVMSHTFCLVRVMSCHMLRSTCFFGQRVIYNNS